MLRLWEPLPVASGGSLWLGYCSLGRGQNGLSRGNKGTKAIKLLWVETAVARTCWEPKLQKLRIAAGGNAEIAVAAEARNLLKPKFVKLL